MTTVAPLESRLAQPRSRPSSRKWSPYIVPTLLVGLALTGCGDSADDPAAPEPLTADDLEQLYAGTHPNGDSYYLAANQPIAIEVSVSGGEVISASQVYLP